METILQRLKKSIESAIQEEFESFVSEMEVYKNGSRKISPKTYFWKLDLNIPRTRGKKQDGTVFFSEIKAKTLEEIFDIIWNQILGLMKLWNTFDDIKNYFQEVYGFSFSNDLLSKIYNSVYDELITFKSRTLLNFYTIVYLDATYIKMKVESQTGRSCIKSVPVYFVIWVNIFWEKEILDFVVMKNSESSIAWQEVVNGIKNRWVDDILIACVDGLAWFERAIKSCFPNTEVQPCIVHRVRNLMQAISYKDKTEFLIEFKKVYNACSQEEALKLLEAMKQKWEKYSILLQDWFYDIDIWWKYFKYSYPLRKLIYSTNVIENFNWLIKANIWKRRVYFTQKSAEISIFLAIQNKQKSLRRVRNFTGLRMELATFFWEKRVPIF